jgi:hypothetical protein
MTLPNKAELQAQLAAQQAAEAKAAAEAAHKTAVANLTAEIENSLMANNWRPATRGYEQSVIDEVISNFALTDYTVRLVGKTRSGCTFEVS